VKVVLNVAAATWLGGLYYLENLALALSRLDATQRPDIVLNGPLALPEGLATLSTDEEAPVGDVVFPNWGLAGTRRRAAEMHWIPDLQHRALPENFSRPARLRRDIGYRRLIRRAQRVVVSSNAVATDVGRAYRRSRSKLSVLHFRTVLPESAVRADPAETLARLAIPDRFILMPNQFWAHKNHRTALAALDRLPLPLVCTGETHDGRRPGFAEALVEGAVRAARPGQLHVLGVVDRADYLQLVRSAAAVLQPSLFEGWSSIVEDARAFGRPVALSDIAVHREQAPGHGFYFAAEDPGALAAAIQQAVEDGGTTESEALRAQEARVLAYARRFLAIAEEAVAAL
jgi:glycosyltransferase involved in cell wall biosynthesis